MISQTLQWILLYVGALVIAVLLFAVDQRERIRASGWRSVFGNWQFNVVVFLLMPFLPPLVLLRHVVISITQCRRTAKNTPTVRVNHGGDGAG